jgi:pilus assembly protein Flp/PilA
MPMPHGRKGADSYRLLGSQRGPGGQRRTRRKGGAEERMGLYARVMRRIGSEEGATAVEYALMIALIALVIVVAVVYLGQSTNSVFENDGLKTALT